MCRVINFCRRGRVAPESEYQQNEAFLETFVSQGHVGGSVTAFPLVFDFWKFLHCFDLLGEHLCSAKLWSALDTITVTSAKILLYECHTHNFGNSYRGTLSTRQQASTYFVRQLSREDTICHFYFHPSWNIFWEFLFLQFVCLCCELMLDHQAWSQKLEPSVQLHLMMMMMIWWCVSSMRWHLFL